MATKLPTDERIVMLLQHLIALELYRSGLSKQQIRKQLGVGMSAIHKMLKGMPRPASG